MSSRRKFVRAAGVSLAVGVAGCSDEALETENEDEASQSDSTGSPQSTTTPKTVAGSWTQFRFDQYNTGQNGEASLPEDPETEWIYESEQDGISPPVLVDSMIYAWQSDGTIFCLDATTGNEQWTVSGTDSSGSSSPQSPAIKEDVLYVTRGDGTVAINTQDESVEWSSNVTGGAPIVAGEQLYVVGSDVVALDRSDGTEHWRAEELYSVRKKPPAVTSKKIIASLNERLVALEKETGHLEWEFTGGYGDEMSSLTAPMVSGETIYFAAQTGISEKIYGVDLSTGEEVWTHLLGDQRTVPVGGLASNDGEVVGLEESGTVFSLPVGGDAGWLQKLNGGVDVSAYRGPVVAESDVVVTTSAGTFVFDSAGKQYWYHEVGDAFGSPVVVDEWLFLTDGEGILHAMR